jgi:hypothetical protein
MRRWRVLIAHDAMASTCDAIASGLEGVLRDVELVDASSIEAALATLSTMTIDVCLVCLDLPPAPVGGVRLAQEAIREGRPVVLVTRSLRWLPPDATDLRGIPWVTPEARPEEVAEAMVEAVSRDPSTDDDLAPAIGDVSGTDPRAARIRG